MKARDVFRLATFLCRACGYAEFRAVDPADEASAPTQPNLALLLTNARGFR